MGHAITPTASKPLARTGTPSPVTAAKRTHYFETLDLAMEIADHAVRSDIECYAHGLTDGWGRLSYDISKPSDFDGSSPDDNARTQRVVDNAMRYIVMRGDVFPWRLFHAEGDRSVVRFEAKP